MGAWKRGREVAWHRVQSAVSGTNFRIGPQKMIACLQAAFQNLDWRGEGELGEMSFSQTASSPAHGAPAPHHHDRPLASAKLGEVSHPCSQLRQGEPQGLAEATIVKKAAVS